MSNIIKAVAVLGVTVLAACGGTHDDEVVIVEPVTIDPIDTKF